MNLTFLPVRFHLRFDSPAYADTPPLFVLRSMMGRNLRSMCCVAGKSACQDCMYNRSCAYSFLFETVLPKDNDALPGRNRGSHPFAFTNGSFAVGKKLEEYGFTLTLFGKAVDYLPYIYAAFVRSGQEGMFKSRTPFTVADVCAGERSILLDEERIDTAIAPMVWSYDGSLPPHTGEILVELRSPLRFKYGGKYGKDFAARDFMGCLCRRMQTLCILYGSASEEDIDGQDPSDGIEITERQLRWEEHRHWSSRQKKAMSLGGAAGSFRLAGSFSTQAQNLLEFARLSGAGKNTNFGLGQLDFWGKSNLR